MPYKDKRKQNLYSLNRIRKRRREWFIKNGPCRICGSWADLELDHINPEDKITHKIWSYSHDKRIAELAKCQPLCSDCHKLKTKEDRRSKIGHGTNSGYNFGCRCSLCRKANRDARKKRRDKRRKIKFSPRALLDPGEKIVLPADLFSAN